MVTPTAGCGALLVAALAAVGITAPLSRPEQSADAAAIHALEDRIEAAAHADDADAVSGLWAADYLFVNPAGERLTRSDRVRMLRSGEFRYDRYARDQEIIRIYGTTALVFYRSTVAGVRGALDISSQRRVTNVLVKRDGRWEVVSQQSSTIQPAAAATTVAAVDVLLGPDATSGEDSEEQIRRVEHDIADATERNDADALDRLWAPEFVWIGPAGQALTRGNRLDAMRSGREKSQHYSIDQEAIRVYGATAVAIFRSTVAGGVVDGKDISSQRMVTNVLVKSGGRWRAVSQHSTLIR
jgi:ketosteroid isomerase-like protein